MKMHIASVLALASLAVPMQSAHALITNGSVCQTPAGSPWTGTSTVPYGAANPNTSGGPLTVDCPLNAPAGATHMTIIGFDRSPGDNIYCQIHAWDDFGNYIGSRTVNTSGGAPGAGVQRVAWVPSLGGTNYSARCTIPAAINSGGTVWMSHILGFDIW